MEFITDQFVIETPSPICVLDITEKVESFLKKNSLKNGLLVISSKHTTGGICINEKCEALEKDLLVFLEDLAPSKKDYEHNKVAVDGRPNAHSHLLGYLTNSSETLVVKDGNIELGQWQRLFFFELDGPRDKRTINLTLMGQ